MFYEGPMFGTGGPESIAEYWGPQIYTLITDSRLSILSISSVLYLENFIITTITFTIQYFSNGKNQICFLTLLQIQVLNKNLTDNQV